MKAFDKKSRSILKRAIIYFVGVIIISINVMIVINCNGNTIPEHRLQWWRDYIDCDENQNKLSGSGITIAVLDTGVDFTHKDFEKCEYEELTVFDGLTDEKLEHGTAIAGIIAGYPHNSKGILGIVPNSKIISIDVANSEEIQTEDLIKGIKIAIDKNVDIINISLGLHEDNKRLQKWIKKAYDKGIVIVASAGNYMTEEVLYPAKYDEVIAVGSYDKKGNIISPKGNVANVIFLPGDSIVSSIPNNKYVGAMGNSFSAAIMTGIVAQIKEKYCNMNNEYIYSTVLSFSESQDEEKVTVDKILKKAKGVYSNEK